MALVLIFALIAGAWAQAAPNGTIIDVLAAHRLTTLESLIQSAGLTNTLRTGGPFTLFAPYNSAISRLGTDKLGALQNDTTRLANVLKYHVVSGSMSRTDLSVNEMMLTALSGDKIRVNYYLYYHRLAVEGAHIIRSYPATNGYVHVVDRVMAPAAGSMTDIISTDTDLTTLKSALDTAGLTGALNDGPYTLLAPTNHAFDLLGATLLQKLLAQPTLLAEVLKYHVIHGTLYSTGMHQGSLHNLEETDHERIFKSIFGTTIIDGRTRLGTADISAANGVIHKIDHVLIPSSLAAKIKAL